MPICHSSTVVTLEDQSQVGEARRFGALMAEALGFGEEAKGRLSIVITEAATNIIKHGRGGKILLQRACIQRNDCVEVLALDKGPGIPDLARSLQDGYSTAGTQGTGLGALIRQSNFFEIYSQPGRGTALLAVVTALAEKAEMDPKTFAVGGVQCTMPGESVCGDAWGWDAGTERLLLAVADGLGHGPEAARAAAPAMELLTQKGQTIGPLALLQEAHQRLRPTRGAALSVCELLFATGQARFAGVGNVAAVITTGDADQKDQHLVSMNGTLGHAVRSQQEFSYICPSGGMVVLHSDGIASRWRLADYPGLAKKHPTLIAGVLFRDFFRERDDATVVVARRA